MHKKYTIESILSETRKRSQQEDIKSLVMQTINFQDQQKQKRKKNFIRFFSLLLCCGSMGIALLLDITPLSGLDTIKKILLTIIQWTCVLTAMMASIPMALSVLNPNLIKQTKTSK